MESNVIPLPHQIIRLYPGLLLTIEFVYWLADEMGLGKDHRGRSHHARVEITRTGFGVF